MSDTQNTPANGPQAADTGAQGTEQGAGPEGTANSPQTGAQGADAEQQQPAQQHDAEQQQAEADRAAAEQAAQEREQRIRTEAAQEAEERLRASLVEAITGKKSGEGEAPTIEDLQATVEAERRAAADARAELAVYRAAAKHEADPARLTDSRAFIEALQGIDVSDAAAVDALIGDHVKANPHLLARRPAGKRSGTDIAGNGGETPRPKTLGEAVAGHYSR